MGLEGPEKAVVGPSAGGCAGTQSVINNTARERERETRVSGDSEQVSCWLLLGRGETAGTKHKWWQWETSVCCNTTTLSHSVTQSHKSVTQHNTATLSSTKYTVLP